MNEFSNSMVERIENYAHLKHFLEDLNNYLGGRGPEPTRFFGSHEDIDVERRLIAVARSVRERAEQMDGRSRRSRQVPNFLQTQEDKPLSPEYDGIND